MAEKKEVKKAAAPKKKKAGKKIHELYTLSGDKAGRKNKHCPKCGAGTFMAAHADRVVCGKCHYVEYVSKK